jgi:hypothetical protein
VDAIATRHVLKELPVSHEHLVQLRKILSLKTLNFQILRVKARW